MSVSQDQFYRGPVTLNGSSRRPFSTYIRGSGSFFLDGKCRGEYFTYDGTISEVDIRSDILSRYFSVGIELPNCSARFTMSNSHDLQQLLKLGNVDEIGGLAGQKITVYSKTLKSIDGFVLA
ncbi:hypothetical protein HZB02_04085 [Candidatus Woesearchaeota archaeon]|nr:hypothetical protein [Candidatus Woesearchaeota archaeon]